MTSRLPTIRPERRFSVATNLQRPGQKTKPRERSSYPRRGTIRPMEEAAMPAELIGKPRTPTAPRDWIVDAPLLPKLASSSCRNILRCDNVGLNS